MIDPTVAMKICAILLTCASYKGIQQVGVVEDGSNVSLPQQLRSRKSYLPSLQDGGEGFNEVLRVFRTSCGCRSAEMRGLMSAKEFDLVRRTCFPKQLRLSAVICGVDFGQWIGCPPEGWL